MKKLDCIEETLAWLAGPNTPQVDDLLYLCRIARAAEALQTELDLMWIQENKFDTSELNRARHEVRAALLDEKY